MQYFKLSNGIMMPAIGSGTNNFGRADSNEYKSELIGDYSALDSALEVGYRMFDTAMAYGNEDGIGEHLQKSGIPREEFFIMGKIPNRAPYNVDINSIRDCVAKSMKDLRIEQFDMFLIHKAVDDSVAKAGGKMDLSKTIELWNNLTILYKEGLFRAIGVSNFEMEHMPEFLKSVDLYPMVNEVRCNPSHRNTEIIELCKEKGIRPIAHSPLSFSVAPGVFVVNEEHKAKLAAIGEKYGKSWAQVQLRYNFQNGVASIPRSSKKANQAASLNIFDFELSAEEMAALSE